jgi:hypothetical protein
MIGILVGWGAFAVAMLWLLVIAPEIAHLFKVPIQKRSSPFGSRYERLTKSQFAWTFGVLDFGISFFIYSFGEDLLKAMLKRDTQFSAMSHLVLNLAFSVGVGIFVGFWSAPTLLDRSPLTEIKLSQKR